MNFRIGTLVLALMLIAQLGIAQYSRPAAPSESDSTTADSLRDSTAQALPTPSVNAPGPKIELMQQAMRWVRRLLYRGYLDNSTSGTSATYALTEWTEAAGPQGPVIAHVTIIYLGAVSWMGKPAEWFQATYKSFENERPTVDFDLVMAASNDKVGEAYRAIWRVDKDELASALFNDTKGMFDFDREDQPVAGEQTVLKLFAGEFPVTKYIGSGGDGAKVVAYRSSDVPPLNLVRLGYGNHSLNLRDRGYDIEPRLQVPLPTSR